MAANDTLGLNQVFQIYHEDGSAYEGLVMHKSATDSVVMSLGDSISGDVYWPDNELELSMHEYITYNGVNYVLVNPPTIVREGMVADNSELKGMTKYSFKFYHPMYQLGNLPFSDVAVTNDQKKYLSENKTFSWIGTANDFLAKLNKNLEDTQWMVVMSDRFPEAKKTEMSDVIAFDKNTVADALKTAYDTWGVPYVIDVTTGSETGYTSSKHFKVVWGLPSNEIYESAAKKQQNTPYIFKMGKGVGLKNNSRTPRNNKIITRIAGYGSENNIPYGYPQIVWTGNQSWDYTINNNPSATNSYPIYDGIVGGQKVRLIKHPFTRTHLMPNVYVDAVNKKVNPNATGYDPDTELKDYYDATEADDYPNPINLQAPSYDIHEFEDIKPELGNETIVGVTPLNPDLTPASEWDDTMDDDGNYLQSYFEITLPTLSFDIYACAAITEAMQINMRSGACLGCTFPVEVDWEDYKANFYNEDGEFDPVIHTQENDGHVRNGKKYPNSTTTSVKLILKKEIETFGTLMPNVYQHPASGDQFVVLGISLPTSYITNAQTRLDNAMKSYMLENNVYYYDYPLKFDEAFLRNNTYILEQLKPNAIVRFEFAGQQLQLFVKQMNVKFGDGVLPKYDITLTDNVDVVLNQIGQVSDDVEKLATLISLLRQSYGNNALVELAKKLSKTDDDTAQGFIRFVKGLQVGERFDSGLLGEGGVFRKDADGTTYIEADKLYIRMRAYFDSVEIRRYMHSGGNRVATPAGVKCVRVDNIAKYNDEFVVVDENGTYWEEDINGDKHVVASGLTIIRYRCYFRAKDNDGNEVTNDFVIGDQAYCHITNGGTYSLQMHHYWRLVVGCSTYGTMTEDGEHWIDLANYFDANNQPAMLYWTNTRGEQVSHKSHQAGSDIPVAQDDIVQLGNADDTYRQGAIIEYSSGEDSPSYKIYQNIDDFSFEDTNFIALGYSSQTGHAYLNVYGDAYIGDPDGSTYIKYEQGDGTQQNPPKLEIKAVIEGSSPIAGTNTTIGQELSDLWDEIGDLQSQIDGSIETWFEEYMPVAADQTGAPANRIPLISVTVEGQTIPCEPYATWYAADYGGTAGEVTTERLKHLGDVFYDNNSGYAFRFSQNESTGDFEWVEITDSATIKALRKANEAYQLADGKNKIFTTVAGQLPPYPWKEGDLWVNATYPADGSTYSNDILKCTHSRTDNGSIADWTLASKYTNDARVEHYMGILAGLENYDEDVPKEVALATANAIDNALGGNFVIEGGLMLMSLIGMRQFVGTTGQESDPTKYTTWAGISGEYDDWSSTHALGHGIAAWYGGDMIDKEMLSDAQIADGWNGETYHLRWAKSIDRFDGSGYRADGNITWDAQGRVAIKDITTLLGENDTDLLNELMMFNNAFHFQTQQGTTTVVGIVPQAGFTELNIVTNGVLKPVATQEWVNNNYVEKTFFAKLFQAYDSNGIPIAPNEANVVNNIKAMVGFWTNQYLSAYGQNSSGGGGGATTLAGLVDTNITSPQNGQVLKYDSTQGKWVNGSGGGTGTVVGIYVNSVEYSPRNGYVTLPDYYIANGTIHLGSNTITPLTSFTETDPTVPSWAKASSKPSYAFSEITGTATALQVPNIENLTNFSTKVYDASVSRTANYVLAAPNGTNGAATFRALVEADIPSLSWSKISTGKPTSWWGQTTIDANGAVKGAMTNVDGITATTNGTGYVQGFHAVDLYGVSNTASNNGGHIDFHYNGASSYTSRIIESESGLLTISSKLKTTRIYLHKPNSANDNGAVYLEYDTANGGVHLVNAGFYADSYVSALGVNSGGGGGGSDYIPLTGSDQIAGSLIPATTYAYNLGDSTHVWRNIHGTSIYASSSLTTYYLTVNSTATVGSLTASLGDITVSAGHGFKVTGKDNTDVLLADGTTTKLKTINNVSIFGSGNIDVSGGGSSGNTFTDAIFVNSNTSNVDNGMETNNGTRHVLFGTGTSGNTGIYVHGIGWIVGANSSGGVYLNGNASTATKLNTAVSLWGNSFDGSASLSGSMTVSDSISITTASSGTPYLLLQRGVIGDGYNDYKLINSGGIFCLMRYANNIEDIILRTSEGGTFIHNDLTLQSNADGASDTPFLFFRRGTFTDTYNDWRIYNTGGYLCFDLNSTTTAAENWKEQIKFSRKDGVQIYNSVRIKDDIYILFTTDTSKAQGISFCNTSNSQIAQILYQNTSQNIILNPLGSSNVWNDAVGKYSLFVGNNKLTYNTYSIWHAGNLTPSDYLPKTGGTITGTLVVEQNSYGGQITVKRIGGSNDSVIRYENASGFLGQMGFHKNGYPYWTPNKDGANIYDLWTKANSGSTAYDWLCKNLIAGTKAVVGSSSVSSDYTLYVNGNGGFENSLTVHASTGGAPYILLQRGTSSDNYWDWKIKDELGVLYFDLINPTSTTTYASFSNNGIYLKGAISGVTNVDSLIIFDTTNSRVGIGNISPSYKLDVNGTIGLSGTTKRIYFDSTHYVELDSSGYFHFSHGVYSDGFVSALGLNSGGSGGAADYIPLSGSNNITGNLIPSNTTSDLGQSASGGLGRWRKIWAVNADFTGTVQAITFSATNFDASNLTVSGTSNLVGNVLFGESGGSVGDYRVSISARSVSSVLYGLRTYGQNYFAGNTIIASNLTVGQSSLNTSYKFYVNGTSYFSGNAVFGNATISNTSGSGTSETKLETSLAVLRLKAASSVYANNTVISSDMRLKYIRSYANASIDQIANAPVFNFVFTDSPQYIHLGTSAQYWQTIFPCGVSEMPDTYLAMDYGATALAAAVITARRVQNHEDRIRELEYENERLRNEIEMLKAA